MKTNQATSLVKMEKEQLQQLCTEVKETLAEHTEVKNPAKQQFSVADLWNIQRTTRFRVQRRNLSL